MQLNRIRHGEALTALGAAVILVSMFFDWAKPEHPLPGVVAQNGWHAGGWPVVALLIIVVVLAMTMVALTITQEPVGLTIAATDITIGIGAITTVVLLIRLTLGQPDLGVGLPDSAVDVLPAAWVGLLGCAITTVGAWLALADERTTAPYSAAPELPPRPIPPTA